MSASAPAEAVARWLGRLPAPPPALAVGVSGGGDSLALLFLLHDLGLAAAALTVDHGLRPEAREEARSVAATAARLGIVHRILVWRWDGRGNLAEAARLGRLAALAGAAAELGLVHCALGHTRDDNVETLFLGLMRGAGLDGLCGMRPVFASDGVTFHRPLLGVTRETLREELRRRGETWAEDPTNEDGRRDRARLRLALADLGLPAERLAQSVAALAATRRDLATEVLHRLEGGVRAAGPDLLIDHDRWAEMTPEFRRRCLGAALGALGEAGHPPRGPALMRLVQRDWTAAPGPATLHGCLVGMRRGCLRISREAAAVPGPVASGDLWDRRWRAVGPHSTGTELRSLGEEGLAQAGAAWRAAGLPRRSLLAAPAVWREGRLLAAAFLPALAPERGEDWRISGPDPVEAFRRAVMAD